MTSTTTTTTPKQPKLKLYYFNINGRGQAIRLFCAYAGLELEDYRFASEDEFFALRDNGTLPFGQVPLLEVNVDGVQVYKLSQSTAILTYLSKLAGLYPTDDPILAAKIDAMLAQDTDTFAGPTITTYAHRFGMDLDDTIKSKTFDTICQEVLPRHLHNFEKILKASPTGWVAGTETPSPADFVWYSRFYHWIQDKPEFTAKLKSLDDFPIIQDFVKRIRSLDAIEAYYANKK